MRISTSESFTHVSSFVLLHSFSVCLPDCNKTLFYDANENTKSKKKKQKFLQPTPAPKIHWHVFSKRENDVSNYNDDHCTGSCKVSQSLARSPIAFIHVSYCLFPRFCF